MKQVRLHNRSFKLSIPSFKIQKIVGELAERINKDYNHTDNLLFISVLNGSFMFTSDLLKWINLTCEVSFVKLQSYNDTKSTGTVRQLIGLDTDINDKHVVIIEDIIETGNTINNIINIVNRGIPRSISVASLLSKPSKHDYMYIDYIGLEIPDVFVVGYGLDYNGLGRNLKDIYKLID